MDTLAFCRDWTGNLWCITFWTFQLWIGLSKHQAALLSESVLWMHLCCFAENVQKSPKLYSSTMIFTYTGNILVLQRNCYFTCCWSDHSDLCTGCTINKTGRCSIMLFLWAQTFVLEKLCTLWKWSSTYAVECLNRWKSLIFYQTQCVTMQRARKNWWG